MQKSDISKCINAAEMGLTQREASTLLDIPYAEVQRLTKKYEIKFVCPRRKANERRRENRLEESGSSVKDNGVDGRQQAAPQPKARTRRNKSTDRDSAKRIDEIYSSNLSRTEKYELLYAEAIWTFEQKMIDLKMRPPFPAKKNYTPENASNAAIRKQREQSIYRRQIIMDCFKSNETKVAEDITRKTKLPLRISSQMLDLMYRDGVLNRERVQVGKNKRNSVYHYSRN
tara:strand:- start:214 stop:900 length:687 start_codon:yes stop_codon:yes gene_type:complete